MGHKKKCNVKKFLALMFKLNNKISNYQPNLRDQKKKNKLNLQVAEKRKYEDSDRGK